MDARQVATFKASNGEDVSGRVYINPDKTYGGWVADSAQIGENVYINEGSVVCPHAVIEKNAVIQEGCFIGECAKISEGCIVYCGTIMLSAPEPQYHDACVEGD